MKKIAVISLGGSLIVPNKIDIQFLEEFKEVLLKNVKKYKFVIVCGGGSIARTYIKALEGKENFQGFLGIAVTRINARFMTYFFGRDANKGIPHDMKDIEHLLKLYDIVFCGALRYAKKETSDATAAKIAHHFHTGFINLTNVHGLHEKDPKKYPSAKFIPEISHKDFLTMAKKIKYKPGQHFILDQKAAKIIKKYNITTYILGHYLKNLDSLLNKKHFIGTIIYH